MGSIEFVYVQHILTLVFCFQIPKPYAIIILHYFLKARKLDDIKLIDIKKVLTSLGVPLPKGQHFT